MELWIRSQDKTFLTIIDSGLFIHEHFNPDDKGLYEIHGSYGGVLGVYTKERALEILDEIQEYMQFFDSENYMGNKTTIVYEMPKE